MSRRPLSYLKISEGVELVDAGGHETVLGIKTLGGPVVGLS